MSSLMFLERFDDGAQPKTIETPVQDLPGYDAGFAAGQAAAESRAAQLSDEVVAQITSLTFGYAEAYQHLMGAITPLFETLSEQVFPAMQDEILASHLKSVLELAAQTDAQAPVTIAVAADQIAPLQALVSDCAAMPLTFVAQDSVGENAALISAPSGETTLIVGELIAEIHAIMRAPSDEIERTQDHG